MPSLYHFNSDQFKENLILGGQHMVAGRLCQYLKGWQLDGIRFLYKHFEKGESCILNDESGLGKVVTTSVFLGAILSNDTTKKCLIIVRDDEYIEGWRFHLSVLTQLSVKVIERTSDINHETVFLIKWSTIKDISQISKTTFDHIIVDNRGEMLTNKFCTGILLRYYESKISIVISSSDVTSDISLLHTLLRLCGRLDRQYADIKSFEAKFQLPSLKEGVCNKIDLEDYFLKREKVINFCREFRLRRYRHQFDEQFPLVPCNDFKRYLQQWRASSNSQSSGSAKLCSSSSEKDVEELFQAYFRVKQERDDGKKDCLATKPNEYIQCEDSDSNLSDELLVMSPLLVVSESESEIEQVQLRNEPSTLVSDEIKEEKEQKDEKTEKETKEHRRKMSKPVKKTAEVLTPKSLRSREIESEARAKKENRKDMLEKSARRRGRPPSKKNLITKSLNDKGTTKSSVDLEKNSDSTKEKSESDKEPKEKTSNKIDTKLDKVEVKKKDTEVGSDTNKATGSKDDEKKMKKRSLDSENNTKKADKGASERPKDKHKVEKPKVETGSSSKTGKDGEQNKLVPNLKDAKSPEKKTVQKLDLDRVRKRPDEDREVVKRSRSKLDDKDEAFEDAGRVKKRKLTDGSNKSKQQKEEENERQRVTTDTAKEQKKSVQAAHVETKKPSRNVHLDLMMEEANKFFKIKNTSFEDGSRGRMTRRKFETSPENKSARGSGGKSDRSPVLEKFSRKSNGKSDKSPTDSKSASSLCAKSDKSPTSSKSTRSSGGKSDKSPGNERFAKKFDGKSDKSPADNKSPINSGSDKTCNSSNKTRECNNSASKQEKDRNETPKRSKPLTVYAVVGVHSRTTRGMQRCTRSSATHSKYMGVSEAQVELDKLSKLKRHLSRHQSMHTERSKSATKTIKSDACTIPESSANLENMELGQALTPTNNCLPTDFTAPIPKKVGYDFPLMLDKDLPDTECFISSENSNRNEVIILTGSTTSDTESEMEPPKRSVNNHKSSMRPPMVTIPRQSHNKAKSPDLFSTCSDLSLPCSQQKNSKSTFEGFKIFGSEVRQTLTSTLLDDANRNSQQRTNRLPLNNDTEVRKDHNSSPSNQPIEDEDAMFEITSNGTFSNMIRVNSNGEMSPLRNKAQSTPPSASHRMNRITNYLISSNQQVNGTSPSPSLDDQPDSLQKTPKRRKSLSGTMKRSPRGAVNPLKPQSTKLTQWLIKNSPIVRISDKSLKASSTKRKRLDLLFPDDK